MIAAHEKEKPTRPLRSLAYTYPERYGYRLRAQMAPEDGTYTVARLDTVTS